MSTDDRKSDLVSDDYDQKRINLKNSLDIFYKKYLDGDGL